MQIKYLSSSARPPNLLQKTGTIVATTALAGAALMFSAVLLTVMLSVGTAAFAYLWWKTRALRKQMRNFVPPDDATMKSDVFAGEAFEGEVIEGEAVRVDEAGGDVKR